MAAGRADWLPMHLSELPALVASPEQGVDVALIQVGAAWSCWLAWLVGVDWLVLVRGRRLAGFGGKCPCLCVARCCFLPLSLLTRWNPHPMHAPRPFARMSAAPTPTALSAWVRRWT